MKKKQTTKSYKECDMTNDNDFKNCRFQKLRVLKTFFVKEKIRLLEKNLYTT